MKKVSCRILSFLLALAMVVSLIPGLELPSRAVTQNQQNIVDRADYFYNLTWVCQKTINGWRDQYVFTQGETYRVPYGQPINAGYYVGYGVDVDTFLAAAADVNSVFYTQESDNYGWNSTYYATDCSAFVSWCWGISRTTTYYIPNYGTSYGAPNTTNIQKLQLGDALNSKTAGHVVLVTDLTYDDSGAIVQIEITEQTPPQMKRSYYTPQELSDKYSAEYTIYRYTGTVPEAPESSYLSGCTQLAAHCTIEVTADTPVMSLPCADTVDGEATLVTTAPAGQTLTATALYRNTLDELWYRVDVDGEEGYLYAGDTRYLEQVLSDITITGATAPNGHLLGNYFYVQGNISSRYNSLTAAAAYIYAGFGTEGTPVAGYSDSVSGNAYTLLNSNIDNNTAFNDAPLGENTYVISADYVNHYATSGDTYATNTGTVHLVEEYFIVVASSVSQTTCAHSYTVKTPAEAACTVDGEQVQYCATCGILEKTVLPATEHNYGEWSVTEPECTQPGSQTRTCANCAGEETQVLAALGHSYEQTVIGGTCSDYPVYEFTCTACGDSYRHDAADFVGQWLTEIPAGMDESLFETRQEYRSSEYQQQTCYEPSVEGWTLLDTAWETVLEGEVCYVNQWPTGFSTAHELYTQYNCADSKVTASETETQRTVITSDAVVGYLYYHWCYAGYPYTKATQSTTYNRFHAYYSTKTPAEANKTDTSDNSYRFDDSTACADSVWYFAVPVYCQKYTEEAKLFTYERWTEYTQWSEEPIEETETLRVEQRTLYRYKAEDLAGHSYDEGVVTTEPTCGAAGVKTFTCAACGDTYTEEVPALGHSYEATVTAPTCTEAGYTTYTCACGDSYVADEVAALGHSYDEGVITTEPTCETVGVKTFTCFCGDAYTEEVPAVGHSYEATVTAPACTEAGYTTYTCACGDSYVAGEVAALGHSYSGGVCTICGEVQPDADYYLFGYINGANYACESDWENLGEYRFVDGKLVATFTQDSYVAVKTGDNAGWYMTEGWQGTDVTSVTLYSTAALTSADKLYVPGNVELTFSLTVNADGSLTLSYTREDPQPVVTPTMNPANATLSFEDEILMNVYFSVTNMDSVVNYGLLTFDSKIDDPSHATATGITLGYVYNSDNNTYKVTTQGIAAKNMGDTVYFSIYAELSDGSYVYTKVYNYSPSTYAYNLLSSTSTSDTMKSLVVAMLNYGAAAQTYFSYNTANLVNAKLTDGQKSLITDYSEDMLSAVVGATAEKKGTLFASNTGFSKRQPSISFEGAFSINYYLGAGSEVAGDVTFYVWDTATYNSVDVLLPENAISVQTLTPNANGEYLGVASGIAAKDLSNTVYVAAVYTGTDGVTYSSGIMAYSIGAYCKTLANGTSTMAPFAKATAVYSYYATLNFNK